MITGLQKGDDEGSGTPRSGHFIAWARDRDKSASWLALRPANSSELPASLAWMSLDCVSTPEYR